MLKKMQNAKALPPNPQSPAAGGITPRPPLASGGWGLRPQTPQTAPPIANFLLRAWWRCRDGSSDAIKSKRLMAVCSFVT